MKIYGYGLYQEMLAKRDKLREAYAHQETEISNKYNPQIAQAKKKAKNFIHYWLYSLIVLIIAFLMLYKKIRYPGSIATLIIIALGVLTILGFTLFFKYKRDVIINKFNEESAKNQLVKDEVIKLNYDLAKISIAVICYSEYHDELSLINDETELNRRFKELYYRYYDAINGLYNHKANVDDFIDYYFKWENGIL